MAKGMTHDEWLYLLEMQVKHGSQHAAQITIEAMKKDRALQTESHELFARIEKKIKDTGYLPNYFTV